MIGNFVKFRVKPNCMDEFVKVSLANSRGSIDGGCYATSVFRDPKDDSLAYVFEVFADEAAFKYHHEQPYYQEWEKNVADLMDGDCELLQNTGFPSEESFRFLRAAVAGGGA